MFNRNLTHTSLRRTLRSVEKFRCLRAGKRFFQILVLLPTVASGSDYYVSTSGSDANSGWSPLSPFRTIKAAASVMVAGDVCHLREGTYRETLAPAHSGAPGKPIIFKAYNREKVVISGADVVTGWTVHSGHVYQAQMGWDLGEGFNQVFVNGRMMHQARWPNTGDDLLSPKLAAASATGNTVSFSVTRPVDHWRGGTVYGLFGKKWAAQAATITSTSATGTLTVWNVTSPWYTGNGNAYITGVFEELDTEKEWFRKDGQLYLWAPGSQNPAGATVEAKARKWCVDLTGKSHIRVEGIDLFAGAVSMHQSSHCELSGAVIQYLSHFTSYSWGGMDAGGNARQGDNGIYMNGDHNVVCDCVIEHSAGSGIVIYGGSNRVSRCVIRYMDYSATYSCPLSIKGSTGGNQILFNTMHDTARDIIQLYGAHSDILMYNHMYRSGRLCHDLGITYQWGRDGQGTVLAYNYIHDNLAPSPNPGIYNDNYSKGFSHHHNVIWNCEAGIRLNAPHDDIRVYNNTLFQCSDIGTFTYNQYPKHLPAYWTYGNVSHREIRNNLFLGANPGTQLVNVAQKDFRLQAGAAAIDAGTAIPRITDGFRGAAPDLGAYESGINAPWTPGHAGGFSGTPVTGIQAASTVTPSSAVLNGVLTNPGDSEAEVWVVWGTEEGPMSLQSWENAISLGVFPRSGVLRHAIDELKRNTSYFYRFYAVNSVGGRWSETECFVTLGGGK
jgi:hypothetical protein